MQVITKRITRLGMEQWVAVLTRDGTALATGCAWSEQGAITAALQWARKQGGMQ